MRIRCIKSMFNHKKYNIMRKSFSITGIILGILFFVPIKNVVVCYFYFMPNFKKIINHQSFFVSLQNGLKYITVCKS